MRRNARRLNREIGQLTKAQYNDGDHSGTKKQKKSKAQQESQEDVVPQITTKKKGSKRKPANLSGT